METIDKNVPVYQLRLELTSGYAAHWLGGWIVRHSVLGPDDAHFLVTCRRSEEQMPPPKDQGLAVDEDMERPNEPESCEEQQAL